MVDFRKDKSIVISKGDTAQLDIHFGYDIPPNGTRCVLTVKEYVTKNRISFEKEEVVNGGKVTFVFSTADTECLGAGDYRWDIRLFYSDGTVLTPFNPALFRVTGTVGVTRCCNNSHAAALRPGHMDIGIHDNTGEVCVQVNGGSRATVVHVEIADRLTSARKISLVGDITGEVDFDGSKDVELESSVNEITLNEIEEMFL